MNNLKFSRWFLLGLAIIGAILRIYNINHGFGSHPDERFLMMRTMELEEKHFNPEFFAYGSLPFYILWGVSRVVGMFNPWYIGYDGLFTVGRSLAALMGVITILLVPVLAKRLRLPPVVGLLGAFFLCFNTFHIQLSRFFTVDIFLTLSAFLLVLACESFARNPAFRRGALVALLLGISFAIKASSLFLLVPVVVAIAFNVYNYNKNIWWGFGVFGLIFIWSLVVMFVCAPYSFLDFTRFQQQTMEQINMVAGKWRPPYTIQYEHTAPYLYHLKQMLWWTMGPSAFSLSIIGFVVALRKFRYGFEKGAVIATLFCAALFLSTAGLQVKFPRYLLPLYPFFALAAAYGSHQIIVYFSQTRWRTLASYAVVFLLAFQVVRAVAAVRVYNTPHTYEVASRWIFNNVPAGSRILGPHWDDSLPISLPGFDGGQYPHDELPIYESDTPGNLSILTSKLANADYIVFPTQRIPGSVLRIPEEMPHNTELLDQLFQDGLGYRLVYSLKIDPELFGLHWSSDLADESLSVYDRPKVWVFKNEDKLSRQQIAERINARAGEPMVLGLNKVLQREAGTQPSAMTFDDCLGSIGHALQFYVLVLALSLVGGVFAIRLFGENAFLMGPTIGVFSLGLLSYLGKSADIFGTGVGATAICFVILAAIAYALVKQDYRSLRNFFYTHSQTIRNSFFAISALYVVICVIRSFQPEVFWGEKPMDASFLNFFLRNGTLPATDPWASGHVMNYYYLGSFVIAESLKLASIPVPFAYNLAMALVSLILLTGIFTVGKVLTRSSMFGFVTMLLVAAGSNAEWIRLLGQHPVSFDFFWATSRLFTSPQITEYPSWSLLFADLHAHVIALSLLPLGLLSLYFVTVKNSLQPAVVFGIIWGFLFGINSWDFITLGFTAGVSIVLFEMSQLALEYWTGAGRKSAWVAVVERGFTRLWQAIVILVSAAVIAGPFYLQSLGNGVKANWGYVQAEEFNFIGMWLRHLGIFAIPFCLSAILVILFVERKRGYWMSYLPALVTPALAVLSILQGVKGLPWGVLFIHTFIAALCCRLLEVSADKERNEDAKLLTFGVSLVYCATILSSLTELFYLLDRMNTTFKFYNFIWILFGVGSLLSVKGALQIFHFKNIRLATSLVAIAMFGSIVVSLAGGGLNIWAMTTFHRLDNTPRPTLNGLAYLQKEQPDEALLWNWMQKNIKGIPVIVEAVGDSYQGFTRAVMHTGLPTILGWQYHVEQRGVKPEDIEDRREAVLRIYTSQSAAAADKLLARYDSKYIVVGDLERKTYGSEGLAKFDDQSYFKKAFEHGNTVLYEVR